MEPTASANAAAEYLVWLAAHECEDDPDFLTPLKLQKLLYYVQGWAFAEWGRPFFSDRIEAWRDGPVVPGVYQRYKGREKLPIIPDANFPAPALTDEQRAFIRGVWDTYKRHSGWALRDMTHLEPAYSEAYKPEDDRARCSQPIRGDRIERDFKHRARDAVARLAAKRPLLRAFAAANAPARPGRPAA